MTRHIFLIDDDPICNFIHKNLIESNVENVQIDIFLDATSFLEFLTGQMSRDSGTSNYILLDINMPEMSGWDFLDEYSTSLKNVNIYMVTSSFNKNDIERSKSYKFVKGYFTKPLNEEKLSEIFAYNK